MSLNACGPARANTVVFSRSATPTLDRDTIFDQLACAAIRDDEGAFYGLLETYDIQPNELHGGERRRQYTDPPHSHPIDERTPLSFAVRYFSPKILNEMYERGVDLNVSLPSKKSLLLISWACRQIRSFEWLLKHGARPSISGVPLYLDTPRSKPYRCALAALAPNERSTRGQIFDALEYWARQDDKDKFFEVYHKGKLTPTTIHPITDLNSAGREVCFKVTPVGVASIYGALEILQEMKTSGFSFKAPEDKENVSMPPLLCAYESPHLDHPHRVTTIQSLLLNDADPEQPGHGASLRTILQKNGDWKSDDFLELIGLKLDKTHD